MLLEVAAQCLFWVQVISFLVTFAIGGHTAELMSYVRHLPPTYSPRVYVVASNDNLSGEKAYELENTRQNNDV